MSLLWGEETLAARAGEAWAMVSAYRVDLAPDAARSLSRARKPSPDPMGNGEWLKNNL